MILDYILLGDRFNNYVTHLLPVDRSAARSLLENQQSQLRHQMISYLEGMYGITNPIAGSVNDNHALGAAEHLQSLDESMSLQAPIGANFSEAFEQLLDQMLKHQFPAHPQFEKESKLSVPALRRVYETVERSTQIADGRLVVEQPLRKEMRQIADPLKLGVMHETVFLLGQHWKNHFLKKEAEFGGSATVGKLRAWIDQPSVMGMPKELQNLVIMAFAAQTNRSFFLHSGPYTPVVENLPDDLELREQTLPTGDEWEKASKRAAAIFGVTTSPLVSATNVAKFATDIKAIGAAGKPSCDDLCEKLKTLLPSLSEDGVATPRYRTAVNTKALLDALKQANNDQVVAAILVADVASSESAMGTSLKKASDVVEALSHVKWELLEAVDRLGGQREGAAKAIRQTLRDAFQKDEYVVALAPALKEVESRAVRLLAEASTVPPVQPQPPIIVDPPVPTSKTYALLSKGNREISKDDFEKVVEEIEEELEADENARLKVSWEVYRP